MDNKTRYHNGLLYLIHLIISADDVIDEDELYALEAIQQKEKMPDEIYDDFMEDIDNLTEREIYDKAIENISECSVEDQIRAFAWLMKISESDGEVHPKEVRFLLYSVKRAGIDFDSVMAKAKELPSLHE